MQRYMRHGEGGGNGFGKPCRGQSAMEYSPAVRTIAGRQGGGTGGEKEANRRKRRDARLRNCGIS